MKISGNILITAAIMLMLVTFICSMAYGTDFNAKDSNGLNDNSMAKNVIAAVLCIAAALGVIITSWHMLRMANAVTSIARLLNNETDISANENSKSMLSVKRINNLSDNGKKNRQRKDLMV